MSEARDTSAAPALFPSHPRIAIVGAGAIGCFLAARLAARGFPVVLVGRQAQVDFIRAHGLTVTEADGSTHVAHLHAVTTLAERPDLILLAVKSQDVRAACQEVLPLAQGVPVVALQNGVQADALAADVLGQPWVLGGVVVCAVNYTEAGHIDVLFPGWLTVGEPFHPLGKRARWVARVLGAAVPTLLTRHMGRARWSKLVFNLNNGLSAATGLTLPEIGRDRTGRRISLALMREGLQVARASGVKLEYGFGALRPSVVLANPRTALFVALQATMNFALLHLPEAVAEGALRAAGRSALGKVALRGSTWQSIARGRPTEVDFLNGEVVRRGTAVGVPTPYNARVVEVIAEVERTHAFAPLASLLPEDERAHLSIGARRTSAEGGEQA